MRTEAERRIGHHYPKATVSSDATATVIAWIWARTVPCPNPACGIEMPLVRSWWLGKKKGKEAYVTPHVRADNKHPSGKRVEFEIGHCKTGVPTRNEDGTIGRSGVRCVACGSVAPLKYVREKSRAEGLGEQLVAVAAEGQRKRLYLPATDGHRWAAAHAIPTDIPKGSLPSEALGFRVQGYGLTEWADSSRSVNSWHLRRLAI